MTLLYAVAAALIAGVILNFMPCVFPVLSLKVLSLSSDRSSHREHRLHGIAYAGGVHTVSSETGFADNLDTITGGGNGKHMVYLSGVTDHHVTDEAMVDHIVRLVEAKAAEIEAASAPIDTEAAA